MKSNTLKAEVATINIGHLQFEGLMFEGGSYGIGVPQVCGIFQFLNKNAARDIKALLGEGFQFLKARTALNPKAVNVLRLADFELLIRRLDKKGNPIAEALADDLVGLSLHQLYSDSFGIKFEVEERQAWLKFRQEVIGSFWFLTDDIKAYIDTQRPSPNHRWLYSNTFDALNMALFNKKAKAIKAELGIPRGALNRDHFGANALTAINRVQIVAKVKIIEGLDPVKAVKVASELLGYKDMDYKV